MKRLTYRLEDQYGNLTDSIILESDLISLNSSEKWKKVLSRLASIEDILGDEYDLERLRELVEADKEGRRIPPGYALVKMEFLEELEQQAALRREQDA